MKGIEGLEAMYLLRFLEPSNSLIYDGYMTVRLDTVPRDCVICGKKFEVEFEKHIWCSEKLEEGPELDDFCDSTPTLITFLYV